MRILLISHDFLPDVQGGIEFYYHHLCEQLGPEIEVLTSRRGDQATFDQLQPYRIHRRAIPLESNTFRRKSQLGIIFFVQIIWLVIAQFLLYTWHGYRLVRRQKIDLILMGQLHLLPVGWLIRLLTGCPYAISLHGSALSRYWHLSPVRWIVLGLLNQAKFLMVNSEFTRQQYLSRGVQANQRFIHIYPGVDVERFHPGLSPEPIIDRHKLNGRSVILTVARLVEWKGQDIVLQALPEILSSVPNALYIIGGEGPYRPELEKIVSNLRLEERVIFTGRIPDEELGLYYAAADVVVLVSREIRPGVPIEGFGMVYLEANAVGCPVVGTRLGGAPEAVKENETGLLVDPTDPSEIAVATIQILTRPELAQTMGQQGRKRAVKEFTWVAQAVCLRQELETILALN